MDFIILRNQTDTKPKTPFCPVCGSPNEVNMSVGRIYEYDDDGSESMTIGEKGEYERCSKCDWIGDDL